MSHNSPYGEIIADGDFCVPNRTIDQKNASDKISTFYADGKS